MPLAPSRRVDRVRGVLLIATLVIAVLIHHGIEHSASAGSGQAGAMPSMASIALPAAGHPAAAIPASRHQKTEAVAEASGSHMGCVGDQMCEASGISKTPSTAHPAAAAFKIHVPQPRLAVGAVGHDPGAAAPPSISAVLRI